MTAGCTNPTETTPLTRRFVRVVALVDSIRRCETQTLVIPTGRNGSTESPAISATHPTWRPARAGRYLGCMPMQLDITDDAHELLVQRGGTMTIDYIRSTG